MGAGSLFLSHMALISHVTTVLKTELFQKSGYYNKIQSRMVNIQSNVQPPYLNTT